MRNCASLGHTAHSSASGGSGASDEATVTLQHNPRLATPATGKDRSAASHEAADGHFPGPRPQLRKYACRGKAYSHNESYVGDVPLCCCAEAGRADTSSSGSLSGEAETLDLKQRITAAAAAVPAAARAGLTTHQEEPTVMVNRAPRPLLGRALCALKAGPRRIGARPTPCFMWMR